ncbi:hypothetical protein DUNSADRAFT_18083 [Dunaliella salina]|uniref:Uncharacterized protein n=1 Tax=Dunaliella salina TaxID=3046 RepID=A0ABQ7G0P1_DUNSA|nr:hypothetical protein DUNSADRAFT_18083 [Dunaliella salina]|eukprot:KAF5828177.1 hypothetical protein DUNSADRAFT_18083 [Dunaliella salina]
MGYISGCVVCPRVQKFFCVCSIWASDPCAFFKIIKTLASPFLFTLLLVLMAQFAFCLLNSCDSVSFNCFCPLAADLTSGLI